MIAPDDDDDMSLGGDEAENSAAPRLSRTQQTRAAASVNQLGVRLSMLSPGELDRLDLPDRLREEIDVNQNLNARRRGRQNRLIGQLLRAEDHEAIRERLDGMGAAHRDGVQHEKINEEWLARIVEEGDPAIEALIADHPQSDRQRLRLLTRSARQDPEAKKAKRARRELLRAIRALRG